MISLTIFWNLAKMDYEYNSSLSFFHKWWCKKKLEINSCPHLISSYCLIGTIQRTSHMLSQVFSIGILKIVSSLFYLQIETSRMREVKLLAKGKTSFSDQACLEPRDPPTSASWVLGIKGVHHHVWPSMEITIVLRF